MSFWTQIANLFKGGGGNRDRLLPIYVLSRRCNEPIAGQVDLFNELSRSEDEGDHAYYTRKVLHTSGEKRCFAEVEIQLWLRPQQAGHSARSGRRALVGRRRISGGVGRVSTPRPLTMTLKTV